MDYAFNTYWISGLSYFSLRNGRGIKVVAEAEAETAAKKNRKRPWKPKDTYEADILEDGILEESSGQSDSDCITVVRR